MERQRSVRRRRKSIKPLSKKCKDFFRKFIAFMFSNVGIIVVVVGYAAAGAEIFRMIEGHQERQITQEVLNYRTLTAEKFWNLTYKMNVFDEDTWREYVRKELILYQTNITKRIKNGYDGSDNPDYSKQWSFSGAFLYALTVITTIGYGNVFPRTYWGKITTILYAIIGMPLFLLYLSNIGDIMARSFKWLYATCCLCRGCPGVSKRRAERRKHKNAQIYLEYDERRGSWQQRSAIEMDVVSLRNNDDADDENDNEDGSEGLTEDSEESYDVQAVTVPLTICLAIMVGYICGGAWLFSKYEDWDFLDGSYFCFISLSTIGFGDFVPGDKIYSSKVFELSFIFCAMYLLVGMALIAMCFNLMQKKNSILTKDDDEDYFDKDDDDFDKGEVEYQGVDNVYSRGRLQATKRS